MGCEKEVHPDKPETGQSPVLSSRGTECQTEGDNRNSGILYDIFKPATHHSGNKPVNQKIFKMASYNNTSDLNNCDQSSVREPVESIDDTLGEIVETDNKSEQSTDENVSHLNHESAGIDNKETEVRKHDNGDTDNISSEVANITVPENTVTETVNATVEMNIRADDETQTSNEHAPSASLPVEVIVKTSSGDTASSSGPLFNANVQLELLHRLEQLKDRLDTCTDIPPILLDVSLDCLKPSTIEYMSFHLDPESDVLSPGEKCKDYRGMAEWIGLENIFIKYISRSPYMLKTREVLSKWLTLEEEPLPTLKNLRKCLLDIDRPDVLEDMSIKMARDAVSWKMTKFEAQTKKPRNEDKSWQLTRHDVVTGKETYYTCCLVYADEDEGMAQIFIKLYKSVYPKALFFLPQFDLKQGKFLYETTAQVIEERCEGKVIFIISEYFFASSVCRFTVQFCKDMKDSTEQGNMIPFNLTNKYEHVPRVLRGIAGIRWFRKSSRKQLWLMLTDSLLGGKISESELEELKERMESLIEKESEYYLSDAPYDDDTPQPGEPISVYDPPPEVENSDDPSARHFNPEEDECLMSRSVSSLEALGYVRRKSNLTRIRHYVRKKIVRRLFGSSRQRRPGPLPSTAHYPPIELP